MWVEMDDPVLFLFTFLLSWKCSTLPSIDHAFRGHLRLFRATSVHPILESHNVAANAVI